MKRKGLRGRVVGGVAAAALLALVGLHFSRGLSQPAVGAAPGDLFEAGYAGGHAVAGFCGRPMVLVFASAASGWLAEFASECRASEAASKWLQERFVGVLVDTDSEAEVARAYGVQAGRAVLVKDLHGPLLGVIEGNVSADDLARLLAAAAPRARVEKSPDYERLLRGTDVLDELVKKGARDEAARAVRLLARFEPGSEAAAAAGARALELGLEQ